MYGIALYLVKSVKKKLNWMRFYIIVLKVVIFARINTITFKLKNNRINNHIGLFRL